MKKNNWFLVVIFLLATAGIFLIVFYLRAKSDNQEINNIEPVSVDEFKNEIQPENETADDKTTPEQTIQALPEKFLLDVPFQSQAPYADWSQPYQDACEEASIIIVKHYLEGTSLSKAEMKSEIDSAVAWQMNSWGGHFDLDTDKTLQLAEDYFGLSGEVIRNYQIDDFKRYISKGSPIVVPTVGRLLGNPNFTGEGPEYHMLVIVGYNDESGVFITNDPGTRKGESYTYKYQTLLDAISGPKSNMSKEVVLIYL